MKNQVYLPKQYSIKGSLFNNPVIQLRQPARSFRAEITNIKNGRTHGKRIENDHGPDVIVLNSRKPVIGRFEVLLSPKLDIPSNDQSLDRLEPRMKWLRPKINAVNLNDASSMKDYCEQIRSSWKGQFSFKEEEKENGRLVSEGLRSAQIGALHETLGHWKVSVNKTKAATIVMPTGTGKTETMLALLVQQRIERLLIVVPTDALRTQIGNKLITLGLLKKLQIVGPDALYPVVGILEHKFNNIEAATQYISSCNVVVTTMNIMGGMDETIQAKIAQECSHLFIDEAHHITAKTWEKFRRFFTSKTILQFTATPYRNDGRHIDGKVIFNFPMKQAQEEGYFQKINFKPLREDFPNKHNEAIARAAVRQLDEDRKNKLDHIVMARTSNIRAADEVVQLYKQLASKYDPVVVHTKLPYSVRQQAIQKLFDRTSRIVVCVDMFGEGFDLPQLKIAALHDIHKSLAVTIQFTGRFTRTHEDIGEATIIANIANTGVTDALRELYSEGSDWNVILPNISEGATANQARRAEFFEGFDNPTPEIPIQNILPKMSTVVFRTNCINWQPNKITDVVKESTIYTGPNINSSQNVAYFVTCTQQPVEWGEIKDVNNTIWDLYVLHWNATQKLLYINSSDKSSNHEELAKAVTGGDAEIIRGEHIFRTMHGINRLILMNLGLKHIFSRATTFTQHAGSDVREGLTSAITQHKIKSNLFGHGFENGEKTSIGCSVKGKIWSRKVADSIPDWVTWCLQVGRKLQDNTIRIDQIIDNAIIPEPITSRPTLIPLIIEWPEEMFFRGEEMVELDVAGERVPFYEAGLEIVDHTSTGPLKFKITTESRSVEYEVQIGAGSIKYSPVGQQAVMIIVGGKAQPLADWFDHHSPTIRFEDGSFLVYNEIYKLTGNPPPPYDPTKIESWDWTGVDLSKESQTTTKIHDSIQYKTIQRLLDHDHSPQYDVVFDDDDAYEAADIIALKMSDEHLLVHLYHCKFATHGTTGARVEDLYAVCGQAQRSVSWKGDIKRLIRHLRRRELHRMQKHHQSRFEYGDLAKLDEIETKAPYLLPQFKIFVVQPGVSKSRSSIEQQKLLAVTELYLQETYAVDFGVIASS